MVFTVDEKGYRTMRWDTLASLPLFMGMSQKELESIMTQTRIDFNKVEAGTVIAKRNQPCGKLTIAISGELLFQTYSDDNAYKIEENVSAPIILQSLGIFGFADYAYRLLTARCHSGGGRIDKSSASGHSGCIITA